MGMARYKATDRQASDSCRYFYFILFHFTLLLFFACQHGEDCRERKRETARGGFGSRLWFWFWKYNGKVNSFATTMAMASVYSACPALPCRALSCFATLSVSFSVSVALALPAHSRSRSSSHSHSSFFTASPSRACRLPNCPCLPSTSATKLSHFHVVLCACVSSRYFICMSYRKRGVFCILCAH